LASLDLSVVAVFLFDFQEWNLMKTKRETTKNEAKGAKSNCAQAFVIFTRTELHVERRHSDGTACKNRTDKETKEIARVAK